MLVWVARILVGRSPVPELVDGVLELVVVAEETDIAWEDCVEVPEEEI